MENGSVKVFFGELLAEVDANARGELGDHVELGHCDNLVFGL